MVGRSPVIEVEMSGVKFSCLVDTGSEVTTITEKFFNSHFKNAKLSNTAGLIKIFTANGTTLPCLGYFLTNVKIADNFFEDIPVLVVKNPIDGLSSRNKNAIPGLLGCNILKHIFDRQNVLFAECNEIKSVLKGYQEKVVFCNRMSTNTDVDNYVGFARLLAKNTKPVCLHVIRSVQKCQMYLMV